MDSARMTVEWVLREKIAKPILDSGPPAKRYPERDWDILVILDACRFDTFAEVLWSELNGGTLKKIDSGVGGTPEFVRRHWTGREHHDTVYVTANVYLSKIADELDFHAVDRVWEDGFDEELRTTLPETVVQRGIEAADRYPNKRIVVHLMQPHAPFIGEAAVGNRTANPARSEALENVDTNREQTDSVYDQLRRGEVTRAEVVEAYQDNLRVAVPSVKRLIEETRGKTVVSADHGEVFGERAWPVPVPIRGHANRIHRPELTEVPWYEAPSNGRRRIIAEPPVSDTSEIDEEQVKDNLRAFGYIE
ncbi:hypothetical protein [Halobaculum roseum]|uniref:Sulfatase n=1 Tax=Halobaculum roseum TaxID=2175149 RepID=A0ABD5MNM3_9EURY|nr:hypothetical protein [Halobaculum roseum]QZY02525.1 hypothetical protein K6T36_14710 [Halobaculum roseum]